MAQLETFDAYFGRLITFQDFLWIGFLWLIAILFRKPVSKFVRVSVNRFLLISLAFAGVVGLSLRFWVASGTLSTFWLVAPEVLTPGFHINANFVLNVVLYIPPAALLILARKSWWKVGLALVLTSFGVETLQQYARIGSGDPFDLLANSVGASLGVLIGLALVKFWPSLAAKS